MTFRFYPSSIALAIAAAALSGCATRQGDGNASGGDARTAPAPIGMSLGDINHRHPMLDEGPRPRPGAHLNTPFVDR